MTHADKVAAARDAVVEAAKALDAAIEPDMDDEIFEPSQGHDVNDMFQRFLNQVECVGRLRALEAATCATCGGTGLTDRYEHITITADTRGDADTYPAMVRRACPARCESGRAPDMREG